MLLNIGFAAKISFDTQINNSIDMIKRVFIAKNIKQADLLAKLTVMTLIEKIAVAKIKSNDISEKDYLQALDKCSDLSNDITNKIINDLKKGNRESLNAFYGFINEYHKKTGSVLVYQQKSIDLISQYLSNIRIYNSNGFWSSVYDGFTSGGMAGSMAGGAIAAGATVIAGGPTAIPSAAASATVGAAIGAGIGGTVGAVSAAAGYIVGTIESHHVGEHAEDHGAGYKPVVARGM